MNLNPFYQHNVFKEISPDTVVLTPNRRLSATLHKLYIEHQLSEKKTAWTTPAILPLTSWLKKLWQDHCNSQPQENRFLLNTDQERFLWEKVIVATKESSYLLQVSETADLVLSAWTLLKQWRINLDHPLFNSADDYIALQYWIREFQRHCDKNNWLDNASLPDSIEQLIQTSSIMVPKHIILFGFTELSPQYQHFFNSCEIQGSHIDNQAFTHKKNSCSRISLPDSESEIVVMARWAKSIIHKQPSARIGCVIPGLDKIRDRVAQTFSEIFAEDNTYTIDPKKANFNLSAGKHIYQYPIITTALQLLALKSNKVTTDMFSYLLASPYLGEAESERIKRANFDSLLRRNNITNIQLDSLINTNVHENKLSLEKHCPKLYKRLTQFHLLTQASNEKQTYHAWAIYFTELLKSSGWPGERSLGSIEFQVVDAWINLLSTFTTLDHIGLSVDFDSALHSLKKIAKNTAFQPKSPEAPIQVLGVLEAAALPFDYLWVAGLDDMNWPPQPKPNPFIPKKIQREFKMPHATAERELFFCETVLSQFKQSSGTLLLSHAEKNDQLELQPSSLIRNITATHLAELELETYLPPAVKIYQAKSISLLADDRGPMVQSDGIIRGGVNIIKTQALCPFKAFAEWRLHTHELESPVPGLRAKDRGTVIHKALELLWKNLQNQASLIALNEDDLNHLINQSIDQAIIAIPQSHSALSQYILLEKKRVAKVIREWLSIEKERPPFQVYSNEKAAECTLGQLKLSLRIDRIDQLDNGQMLIIDYKTGKHNEINTWFGDRPEEPQLPLYTLLESNNIFGISFAQVCPGEYKFIGVGRQASEIKGIKTLSEIKNTTALSWNDQIQQWQVTLLQLSDDFYEGKATVDPKDPVQTCMYCTLKSFCRVNEEIEL